MNHPLGLLLPLALVIAAGCQKGDGPSYANVTGKVTYNGQPLEKGQITFATDGRPPSTIDIIDGKFTGQAMVGSNKVSVSAKKKSATPPQVKGGAAEARHAETQMKGYMKFKLKQGESGGPPVDFDPSMVDYIPPEWGAESKQMRVIEAGVTNEFNIDIKGPKN